MKKVLFAFIATVMLVSCDKGVTITVDNPSSVARDGEVVEVTVTIPETPFIVVDANGVEVPYQVTFDKKLLLLVNIPSGQSASFTIKDGEPGDYAVIATGKQYPERVDDIAWENDRIAFRLYGPALQASGEKAYGYDVWVKRVSEPVVAERYKKDLQDAIPYHNDNGNGLDYYKVGPTLGAGASALLYDGKIVYPYCYKEYEILDNGPLRFTVKLTYNPLTIGDNNNVVETRLLSLDAGSQLNKMTISFSNLKEKTALVTGIVLHDESDNYVVDSQAGYMAYADPNDEANGQTFLAAVFPETLTKAEATYFEEAEASERGASGHLLAYYDYAPDTQYTYYFGAGWSKWGFSNQSEWFDYVKGKAKMLKEPLVVSVAE